MLVEFNWVGLLVGLGLLAFTLVFIWRKKRNLPYLFLCTLFGLYLLYALSLIIFPFTFHASLPGVPFHPSINLNPFDLSGCSRFPGVCLSSFLENIVVTLPFGFGIGFIIRTRPRRILWLGLAVGVGFELIQLVISYLFQSAFRAVDINDTIFNALGVWLGYGMFRLFAWLLLKTTARRNIKTNGLLGEIHRAARDAIVKGETR